MTMKELTDILMKDIMSENFSKRDCVIYGIIAPVVLIIIALVGAWLESL